MVFINQTLSITPIHYKPLIIKNNLQSFDIP